MLPPWIIEQKRNRRQPHRQPAFRIEAPRPTLKDYQEQEKTQEQRDEQGRVIVDFTLG